MASWFDTLFAPFDPSIGTNAAQQAAAAQQAGIGQGYNQLSDLYSQGRGALTTNYMAGLSPYLQSIYGPGGSQAGTYTLGNALGLNGPQGTNQAFQDYSKVIAPTIQMGSRNVQRQAAATGGGPNSGATQAALQDLAQKTAMGGWQSYVQGLTPYLNYNLGMTTGQGGMYGALGTGLNQSFQGQGGAAASAAAAEAAAQANADLAAAQAQYGAGANMWGGIFGALNAGSKVAGAFPSPSDIRLKDDVERVGTLNDGIPVYRYRFKGSPRTEIGVMAQDVEQVNPEAVVEHPSGFKMVDYRKATSFSAGLEPFLRAA